MCEYGPKCPTVNECSEIKQTPLTEAEKRLILKRHNELRSKIASGKGEYNLPSASNMRELKWNNELAKIAQCSANQCEFQHDTCRKLLTGDEYGQNVGESVTYTSKNKDYLRVSDFVDNWYNEIDFISIDLVYSFFDYHDSSTYLHFTQLIWANTNQVGCGIVRFYDDESDENCQVMKAILFCNYWKIGNVNNKPIYMVGKPASNCKYGVSKIYPYLCQ
ncbi:scoloptoxin SSD976-like [Chrysoperla carnea]|uniref:scoloptoxin SSD976-like n=1 Tax=Chrysoperla carnea TaxID=189513 RepID=UPI001D098F3D|nr:scoloptoxin SSD976-like [Chrysoperla carnea]